MVEMLYGVYHISFVDKESERVHTHEGPLYIAFFVADDGSQDVIESINM